MGSFWSKVRWTPRTLMESNEPTPLFERHSEPVGDIEFSYLSF